jgi:uncharacterized protein YndB with AHSA1/START domain
MTVTSVDKDSEALAMAIVSEFDAPIERVWQVWADPRQLEQWWGPPTYPATFEEHDLTPGGRCTYFMTGPDGDKPHGWWRVVAVDPPNRLEFENGFADDSGAPNPDMPVMTMRVTLAERSGGGTRMTINTNFASVDDMEQILDMGFGEGIAAAIGQIDALLAR